MRFVGRSNVDDRVRLITLEKSSMPGKPYINASQ